jgi:hypothetical protein
VTCLCSPLFQGPATYIVGVYAYGSVNSRFMLVATVGEDVVIDTVDGVTYSGRISPPDCKYYQYVAASTVFYHSRSRDAPLHAPVVRSRLSSTRNRCPLLHAVDAVTIAWLMR